jgi:hypothetical protein
MEGISGTIGGFGSGNSFKGLIDEPRIYNRALTEAEIRFLAENPSGAQGGLIVAERIMAESITAGKIATDAIEARHVKAGEITADKIDALELQTLLLRAAELWLGYTGGYDAEGVIDPDEGDRRIFQDGDEIQFQEYTNEGWTTVNSIIIGGSDSGGNFLPFFGCRGVYNPLGDPPAANPMPYSGMRHYSFETDLNDQNGVASYSTYRLTRSTDWSAFGSYSLKASTPGTTGTSGGGYFVNYDTDLALKSFTGSAYWHVRRSGNSYASDMVILRMSYQGSGAEPIVDFLLSYNSSTDTLKLRFREQHYAGGYITDQDVSITAVLGTSINTYKDFFTMIGYDRNNNKIYLLLDNTLYQENVSPPGNVTTAVVSSYTITVENNSYADALMVYVDDVVISTVNQIDIDVFRQYYLSGLPWNTNYAAADTILLPAPGGVVRSMGDHVVEGALTVKGGYCSRTVTGNTTISQSEIVNVNAASATITISSGLAIGTQILIRKINAGAGTITIAGSGSEVFTRASFTSVTLTSDGDFWTLEKVSSTRWELTAGVESGEKWIATCNGKLDQWQDVIPIAGNSTATQTLLKSFANTAYDVQLTVNAGITTSKFLILTYNVRTVNSVVVTNHYSGHLGGKLHTTGWWY